MLGQFYWIGGFFLSVVLQRKGPAPDAGWAAGLLILSNIFCHDALKCSHFQTVKTRKLKLYQSVPPDYMLKGNLLFSSVELVNFGRKPWFSFLKVKCSIFWINIDLSLQLDLYAPENKTITYIAGYKYLCSTKVESMGFSALQQYVICRWNVFKEFFWAPQSIKCLMYCWQKSTL